MSDLLGFPLGNSGVGTADPNNAQIGPQLNEVLRRYGLTSLAGWASRAVINGWSPDQIMLELYQRPEFKTRFAGMFMLEQNGQPPISVDEYLDYERTVTAVANTIGMEITKDEMDNLIGNGVSPLEAEKRIGLAATAVYEADAETKSELTRLFGVSLGQLAKYWMDPKTELAKLQSQYRMGEIAGAALRTGRGAITKDQAQRLADAGLDRDSAVQGFGQLATMGELFNPMDMGEVGISDNDQIEFLAGNAKVGQEVEAVAAKRKAEFEAGGGFATGKTGFAVGSADS